MFSRYLCWVSLFLFFFNDTATTEIYTLSLHDALPIYCHDETVSRFVIRPTVQPAAIRSLEIGRAHVELQSHHDLVCRLLLEKKKTRTARPKPTTERPKHSISSKKKTSTL